MSIFIMIEYEIKVIKTKFEMNIMKWYDIQFGLLTQNKQFSNVNDFLIIIGVLLESRF